MWKLDDNRSFLKMEQNLKHPNKDNMQQIHIQTFLIFIYVFFFEDTYFICSFSWSTILPTIYQFPISHCFVFLSSFLPPFVFSPDSDLASSHWLSVLLQRKYFYLLVTVRPNFFTIPFFPLTKCCHKYMKNYPQLISLFVSHLVEHKGKNRIVVKLSTF